MKGIMTTETQKVKLHHRGKSGVKMHGCVTKV